MAYPGIDRRKNQSLLRLYDREPILRMQQQVSHLNREALPCENFDAAALRAAHVQNADTWNTIMNGQWI